MGAAQPSVSRLSGALCHLDLVSRRVDGGKDGHQRRVGWLRGCSPVLRGQLHACCEKKHDGDSGTPSGNIVVLVRSLLVTFHVVSIYERLDPLLQITRLWRVRRVR